MRLEEEFFFSFQGIFSVEKFHKREKERDNRDFQQV